MCCLEVYVFIAEWHSKFLPQDCAIAMVSGTTLVTKSYSNIFGNDNLLFTLENQTQLFLCEVCLHVNTSANFV
jgi:hypothetical protein